MPSLRYVAVALGLWLVGGCHFGWMAKRASELGCPTDIRQTVPGYIGEDAVFHCPCGPSPAFYGYRPTCWGIWPTPGSAWRDAYCGGQLTDPMATGTPAVPGFHSHLEPQPLIQGTAWERLPVNSPIPIYRLPSVADAHQRPGEGNEIAPPPFPVGYDGLRDVPAAALWKLNPH